MWIDNRLNEQKVLRERELLVRGHAPVLYDELWKQILESVNYAQKKAMSVGTNGSQEDRIVWMSSESMGERRELHIRLAGDRKTISASGPGIELRFDLDICDDGLLCLKNSNGVRASNEFAAEQVLDPFFFPELHAK